MLIMLATRQRLATDATAQPIAMENRKRYPNKRTSLKNPAFAVFFLALPLFDFFADTGGGAIGVSSSAGGVAADGVPTSAPPTLAGLLLAVVAADPPEHSALSVSCPGSKKGRKSSMTAAAEK